MPTDIFQFDDYREYIKARVKEEKSSWGIWARLARAAHCQPTYLTQAMKGRVHLTADHIHYLAEHWRLADGEAEFFLLLLEHAKAASRGLRERLMTKIRRLRQERDDLSKRFAVGEIETGEKESTYYSSWHFAAIHMIVTIPEFRTANAIARRLQLPIEFVENSLNWLAKHHFVKLESDEWRLSTADLHISKRSPMVSVHHNSWRQRAVLDALIPSKQDSVHFTGVYSLSRTDFSILKSKMQELIETSRKIVAPSKEEELVCFACDLFTI